MELAAIADRDRRAATWLTPDLLRKAQRFASYLLIRAGSSSASRQEAPHSYTLYPLSLCTNNKVLQNEGVKMRLGFHISGIVNFASLNPFLEVIFLFYASFSQKSSSKFEKVPFSALFGPSPPVTGVSEIFFKRGKPS